MLNIPNTKDSKDEREAGTSHLNPSQPPNVKDATKKKIVAQAISQHNSNLGHVKFSVAKDHESGEQANPPPLSAHHPAAAKDSEGDSAANLSHLSPNHHSVIAEGKNGSVGGPKTFPKVSLHGKKGKGLGGVSFSLPSYFKESAGPSCSPPRPEGGFGPWEVDPSLLTIGSLLGHGSYAKVYKGTYKGDAVAIKMLEWGDQATHFDHEINHLRGQFYREVENLYRLQGHPNVCRFLGASFGSTHFSLPSPNGQSLQVSRMMCCIVMEYLQGGTLRQYWVQNRRKRKGKRRMPYSVVVQFALDIAKGLEFLHSKNICHRDLKPDNILLDKYYVLKIADFGVSRVLPKSDEESMTSHVGTPNYCAPEILCGSAYSLKCDVYSYGVCIWEIYTCNFPYPDVDDMYTGATNKRIIDHDYRPHIPHFCPKELKRIMAECWVKNPHARPSMSQVVAWLQEINVSKTSCCTNETVVESCACVSDALSTACY